MQVICEIKRDIRPREMPDTWLHFRRLDDFAGEVTLMKVPQEPKFLARPVLNEVRLDEVWIGDQKIKTLGEVQSTPEKLSEQS